MSRLRVAVVGVGSVGQHHARILAAMPHVELVGVVDIKPERAAEIASRYGTTAFTSASELVGRVDAVSIATPTVSHVDVALPFVESGAGVLVEKPLAAALADADRLLAAADAHGTALAVGHTERFNPAVTAALPMVSGPRFVEIHRLGTFPERSLDIDVRINRKPCELPDPIHFDLDEVHRSYDAERAQRFWRVLVQVDRVLKIFRARFIGKSSPVHFFWGAADLAVTRFSGRTAPEHPGGIPNLADWVTREAYSHEVSSCGFWPGGGAIPYPAFYSYAYPEPAGFAEAHVRPEGAFYSQDFREFAGTVSGGRMEGTFRADNGSQGRWSASKM